MNQVLRWVTSYEISVSTFTALQNGSIALNYLAVGGKKPFRRAEHCGFGVVVAQSTG